MYIIYLSYMSCIENGKKIFKCSFSDKVEDIEESLEMLLFDYLSSDFIYFIKIHINFN